MKAILITRIEWREINSDSLAIPKMGTSGNFVEAPTGTGTRTMPMSTLVETVRVQSFTRPDWAIVRVAMSSQAAEVIGIQYEVWGNMIKQISETRRLLSAANAELSEKKEVLHRYQDAGFWERLKWAFLGGKL